MRRSRRLYAAAAVALVAVAVPVLLVSRVLPGGSATEVVAAEGGSFVPVALKRTPAGSQRLVVDTPRYPAVRGAEVLVRVGTYLRRPSQTIHMVLRGPRSEALGSCLIAPSRYHDNGLVECPVARSERLRRMVVAVDGPDPLALYVVDDGGRLTAGTLARQRHLAGVEARLRVLRERVGVTRPPVFAAVGLFVLLVASLALFGATWLVAGMRA